MDTRNAIDTALNLIIQYGIIVVMYLSILQYRLPYLQTLAIYAGLSLIPPIYAIAIKPAIYGRGRVSQGPGILAAILMMLSGFILLGISLYRFSILETIGMMIAGFAVSTITILVLGRL